MSFLYPNFLYFVLPPLFILFGFLLTQKESQEHFFSEDVMSKLRVSANTLTMKARNALFLLMGFFMVIALAQPVIKDGVVKIKAKSADIMIALDISDSMLATDVYPNRLELAKQKALLLLDNAPNERVGIVAFAKSSYLVSPLSFDHSAVSFLLRQLDTSSITQKGTDYLGILDVIAKVKDVTDKKYLLILTDGGDKDDFSKEISYAKDKNIVVFVLGIGTKKGSPVKLKDGTFIKHNGDIIVTKLNESIADLATKSGGVYIQNSTANDDILAMLSEIDSVSEEKELSSEEVPRYTPLFYYPLGMALFLLLIATSSMRAKSVSSVFMLFALFLVKQDSHAGIFDFMELDEAKKSYNSKDYKNSAEAYTKHAQTSNNGQSFYNAGNSFYKNKNYKEALESYQKAVFDDENQRANNFSNIGNTHIKLGEKDALQKAKESYEKSLEIREDKDTRENLDEVEKLIKKQKQEQKDKNKKDKEKNKDKKDSDKKDKKSDKDKDSKDSKENQEKSDKDKKSDDKKDSSKSEKDDKKKQDSDKSKSKEESDKNKENNKTKPEEKKKDELKNLDDEKKKDENQTSSTPKAQQSSPLKMSEREAQKWLQQLNQEKNTYMYRLDEQKPREENTDEKPW